jgi:type II secretion system protein J
MKNKPNKSGFTLVELLVAMTIIVTIVSMVYGSYFATSKSAQACKVKIAGSRQARRVLVQMARQIRCSYTGVSKEDLVFMSKVSKQKGTVPEDKISYFSGSIDNPDGEILHFVTTNSFWAGRSQADGLFEVIYKFDKSKGSLFLSQQEFIGVSKSVVKSGDWQQVASNVDHFGLAFFDGLQWLKSWSIDSSRLPGAVKIDITCSDENNRQYHYETVAYIYCRKN